MFAALYRKCRGALAPRPFCGAAVRRQEPSDSEAIPAKQAEGDASQALWRKDLQKVHKNA